MTVDESAATPSGLAVATKDRAKSPSLLRAHSIPAEAASAGEAIRYAETNVRDGPFGFKHIAPGKYSPHARQVVKKEANDARSRPIARDAIERAKLRRGAMAAKNEIELQPRGRVKDYAPRFKPRFASRPAGVTRSWKQERTGKWGTRNGNSYFPVWHPSVFTS